MGAVKPAVTVVVVQGGAPPGVTMETDPERFADQIFVPSNARDWVKPPNSVETVVTSPAAWRGGSRAGERGRPSARETPPSGAATRCRQGNTSSESCRS